MLENNSLYMASTPAVNFQDEGNTQRSVISQNQLTKIEEFRKKLDQQSLGTQLYSQRIRQGQKEPESRPLSLRMTQLSPQRSSSQMDYLFQRSKPKHSNFFSPGYQSYFASGFSSSQNRQLKKTTEQEWLYPNVLRDLRMPVDAIIKPHKYRKLNGSSLLLLQQ